MASGYNGKTTIDFHINRIKDLQTDQYRLMREDDDPDREEELELQIEGRSYFTPGKYWGPYENSYPDEGETEILSITWNGKEFPWDLTKEEKEQAEDMICNAVQDQDEPDPPSDDYDDYDDRDYEPYDYPEDY